MAEKENSGEKESAHAHTEPMTTEMRAAVETKRNGDDKPAAKRKSAPKKGGSGEKGANSATHPKDAIATTAATGVIDEGRAERQTTEASIPPQPVTPSTSDSAEAPSITATAETPVGAEKMKGKQWIRQKLVDLGVADAAEMGVVTQQKPDDSTISFWIKTATVLLVIVALYLYSGGSDDVVTPQDPTPPVRSLEDHLQGGGEPTRSATTNPNEGGTSSSDPERLPTEVTAETDEPTGDTATQVVSAPTRPEQMSQTDETTEQHLATPALSAERPSAVKPTADDTEYRAATTAATFRPTAPVQIYYIPGYRYPCPSGSWIPNPYPPFNLMNRPLPVNPYFYPPINMAPRVAPSPYYPYPAAPYRYPQPPVAK